MIHIPFKTLLMSTFLILYIHLYSHSKLIKEHSVTKKCNISFTFILLNFQYLNFLYSELLRFL